MEPQIKEVSVKRQELIQVHDHCPERPYVELEVPQDAKTVCAVSFTAISRDQGWADTKEGPSYTWFDTQVRRPEGRSDLRIITVMNNRLAETEFFEQTHRWHLNDGPRRKRWIEELCSGDVIQLIPKANYRGWVNIIKECRIKIEYQPISLHEKMEELHMISNVRHYTSPLDSSKHEIRLLHVEPGAFKDPIKGYFTTMKLEDAESHPDSFHALSYCWGDPADHVDIFLGESEIPFSVGRPVAAALRRLRFKEKPLVIWIDAVCINQEDLEERAQQVNLMSHIYSLASNVHIYLGKSNSGVEACLQIIRDLHNYNVQQCPGGAECSCFGTPHAFTIKEIDTFIQAKEAQGKKMSFRGMYEIFEMFTKNFTREVIDLSGGYHSLQLSTLMSILFENPWFSRVWVVQEALFSRKAIVHCGPVKIPWKELVAVNKWLENPHYIGQQQHIKSQTVLAPIWKTLRPSKRVLRSLTGAVDLEDPQELSGILEIFLAGLDLKATDPRDKLFALLTFADETCIVRELDELILPNYDKGVDRVFADFTRWWIKRHGSLSVLSAIHTQPGRTWQRTSYSTDKDVKLRQPSWAVSSEGDSKWSKANLDTQFNFSVIPSSTPDLNLLDNEDPLVLKLSGYRFAEIVAIGHAPIEFIYPYRKNYEQHGDDICMVFDKIIDPCAFTGFWGNQSELNEKSRTQSRAMMEYGDHNRAHWGYFTRDKLKVFKPTDKPLLEWYTTDNLPTCLEPCFFKTTNGTFGLCPWTSKEGDVIALLEGGSVPYLLRPMKGEDGDKFQLVGECFVHGIMHGELFADGAQRPSKEIFSLV